MHWVFLLLVIFLHYRCRRDILVLNDRLMELAGDVTKLEERFAKLFGSGPG